MPTDRVWWVNQSVAGPGTGTEADPYKNFTNALGNIAIGELGTIYFATPGIHAEKFEVFEGVTVALIGKSQGTMEFQGAPTVVVNQDGVLFAHDVDVVGGGNVGVVCTSCQAWLSSSEITENDDGGIDVQGTSTVRIKNLTVGGFLLAAPAIAISAGSNVEILYSTLVGGVNNSAALVCQGGATVGVRNSLLASANANPELVCAGVSITDSATESAAVGSVALGQMPGDGSWFADFAAGDLRLSMTAPSEIATAAVWHTGDPSADIEGDARPTMDGTPDYAGADVPN